MVLGPGAALVDRMRDAVRKSMGKDGLSGNIILGCGCCCTPTGSSRPAMPRGGGSAVSGSPTSSYATTPATSTGSSRDS